MLCVRMAVPSGFDLGKSTRALGVGANDGEGRWWWAWPREHGVVSVAIEDHADSISVRVWGDRAERAMDEIPVLLGFDDPGLPPYGPAAALLRSARGLHLGSTRDVHGALVAAVLGQQVTTREAHASLRALVQRYGSQAPGPRTDLRTIPAPEALGGLRYEDLHALGIEERRAKLLIEVSRRAARLSEILEMDRMGAYRRLEAIAGIGPWTSAMVMGPAWGDRDAVPVGDFHLPNSVAWALAGEERADDDRMLELLDPYRPHRRRVIVAIKQASVHAPRYGPRSPIRRHL